MAEGSLRIAEVIRRQTVDLALEGIQDKDKLMRYLTGLLHRAGKLRSEEEFLRAV